MVFFTKVINYVDILESRVVSSNQLNFIQCYKEGWLNDFGCFQNEQNPQLKKI